jgi:mannose-1-phosphate guanylyltransferase
MRALLLAAGVGSRLRPLTDHVPKCLAPICGVPLLDIWLAELSDAGVERFLINTCYMADVVEAHLAASRFASRIDIKRESKLLGTAGSIRAYRDWLADDDVIIAHADNLSICDFRAFVQTYRDRPEGIIGTMMTFTTDTPANCGIVLLDASGRIVRYWEKDPFAEGKLANAAVYVASPEFCDIVAGSDAVDLSKDVVPLIYAHLITFNNDVYHRDIGTIESFAMAQIEFSRLGLDRLCFR